MLLMETMESRRLLSTTLTGTTLEVTGSNAANVINVWINRSDTRYVVRIDGRESSFRLGTVRMVEVNALGGNDRVAISDRIRIPADLYGGSGNDWLSGGSGNDDIEGNAGNDTLLGNAGNDALEGNAGNDSIDGGTGADEIEGGTGVDVLVGGPGLDLFDEEDARAERRDFNSREDRVID